MIRLNKRAKVYFIVIMSLIFMTVLLPTAWYISYKKETKFSKLIGESQLLLLKTYEKGESVLYYIDRSAELSLMEILHKYSTNAGLSSGCGCEDGYCQWNTADVKCWPTDVKSKITTEFKKELKEYFDAYPEKIPEIEYDIQGKANSTIGKANKKLRIDITEDDVFNFKIVDGLSTESETEYSDNTGNEGGTLPNTPTTSSTNVCTYCYGLGNGWDSYWASRVSQWDSSAMSICSGHNYKCCKAKCPPESKIINVPYINQCDAAYGQHGGGDACNSMCGPTSVKMINDYYGGSFSLSEWELVKGQGNWYGGAYWSPMAGVLGQKTGKNIGYSSSNKDINFIASQINQGRPMISGLRLPGGGCPQSSPFTYYCWNGMGHIYTIVGYSNEGLIFNDPFTHGRENSLFSATRSYGEHIVIPFSSFQQISSGSLIVET